MGRVERLLHSLDGFQQRHRVPAVLWAVQKKYSDDRGGHLAALIAYYGFLSLFPCLLVLLTIFSYLLASHPALKDRLANGTLGSFPVVGETLRGHVLHGNVLAIVLGGLALLWGAQGVSQALQFAMFEMWNVKGYQRPGFLPGLARSALLFGFVGLGTVLTTWVTTFGSVLDWGPGGSVLAALPSSVLNIGLYEASFKILSPRSAAWRDLVPGAALAAASWQALQTVGVNLVHHQVAHASALYGSIGTVIGALGFLYLAARLTVYCAELNVVLHKHLWPRSLVPPPRLEADRRQLVELAQREERHRGERVTVDF